MVFLVLFVIFLVLVAIIASAASANRRANYQMGPGYVEPVYIEPQPVIVDDTPFIAGMVAADIATDIAMSESMHHGMADQGGYFDQGGNDFGGNDFGGNDFMGGNDVFDSGSSGFDIGGGDF